VARRRETDEAYNEVQTATGTATSQPRHLPMAPVMAMPATMTPAPVTVTPTPMTVVPTPVVAMTPPHLLRLEAFDFLTCCHGWMCILTRSFNWRLRKQRSRLRSRGKRGRTGCKSSSKFQKLSAFHGVPLMSFRA
jgi:hypothetical protein